MIYSWLIDIVCTTNLFVQYATHFNYISILAVVQCYVLVHIYMHADVCACLCMYVVCMYIIGCRFNGNPINLQPATNTGVMISVVHTNVTLNYLHFYDFFILFQGVTPSPPPPPHHLIVGSCATVLHI